MSESHVVSGTIESVNTKASVATVRVDASASCERCARGQGCGLGLNVSGPTIIDIALPRGFTPRSGQQVSLEVCSGGLLPAALVAYGLPLVGLITGASIGTALNSEALAAVSAVAGLLLGAAAARRLPSRLHPTPRLRQ